MHDNKYSNDLFGNLYQCKEIYNLIQNLDVSEMIFLWNEIDQVSNITKSSKILDISDFRVKLYDLIISKNIDIKFIKNIILNFKNKDYYSNFLNKHDDRQINFLYKFLLKNSEKNFRSFFNVPKIYNKDIYFECICQLNFYGMKNGDIKKLELLNKFKSKWISISLNKKHISWIDKKNYEQIEWAYSYIRKMKESESTLPEENYYFLQTDPYIYVIIEIDALSLGQPAEKILFLDKMRRAWSQKKFRDAGKTKKAYHLPLTKETHKQLEFLSQILNKPQAQVLESTIRDKYQEYSDEKTGKNLY